MNPPELNDEPSKRMNDSSVDESDIFTMPKYVHILLNQSQTMQKQLEHVSEMYWSLSKQVVRLGISLLITQILCAAAWIALSAGVLYLFKVR